MRNLPSRIKRSSSPANCSACCSSTRRISSKICLPCASPASSKSSMYCSYTATASSLLCSAVITSKVVSLMATVLLHFSRVARFARARSGGLRVFGRVIASIFVRGFRDIREGLRNRHVVRVGSAFHVLVRDVYAGPPHIVMSAHTATVEAHAVLPLKSRPGYASSCRVRHAALGHIFETLQVFLQHVLR